MFKTINLNNEKKKITHSIEEIFSDNNNSFINTEEKHNMNDDLSLSEIDIEKLITDAKEKAIIIIKQAKEQAEEIIDKEKNNISKWWDEKRAEDNNIIENIKKNGYNEGFSEGKIIAEEETQMKYQSLITQSQRVLDESYKMKGQIINEAELSIIEISILIAEKIIIKETEIDKNIIKSITKEALKNINEFEKISIYVNPEDFPFIQNAREDLLNGLNGQVELKLYPDFSITSGGCIIKTSTGTLDAKIDTQLGEIKQALYDITNGVIK